MLLFDKTIHLDKRLHNFTHTLFLSKTAPKKASSSSSYQKLCAVRLLVAKSNSTNARMAKIQNIGWEMVFTENFSENECVFKQKVFNSSTRTSEEWCGIKWNGNANERELWNKQKYKIYFSPKTLIAQTLHITCSYIYILYLIAYFEYCTNSGGW